MSARFEILPGCPAFPTIGGRAAPQTPLLFPGGCRPRTPATFSLRSLCLYDFKTSFFERVGAMKLLSNDRSRKVLSNALVKVSNGLLEPELWHIPHV